MEIPITTKGKSSMMRMERPLLLRPKSLETKRTKWWKILQILSK